VTQKISIQKTRNPKARPDQKKLGFGQHFTDHMFIMDYSREKGWYDPRIVPYGPLELDPATMVFHYGQAIFEGLKAYRTEDGRINLFRPEMNMKRVNNSNERMSIPQFDEAFGVEAIKALVSMDRDWIPTEPGTSLYIRPFIIATDPFLGVRSSNTFKFMIILSPSGAYYPSGINPVKIMIENEYVRAVRGGTGFAKTPANYAISLKAQELAHDKGYVQVLWLDGVERKYIEEVGSMNVFFKIGDEVVTPELNGSILPGITRDSCIHLIRHWGVKVTERKLSAQELFDAHAAGKLTEAFGTGTAAVISPIGELNWDDKVITVAGGKIGDLSAKLYETITGIQRGSVKDEFKWITEVK